MFGSSLQRYTQRWVVQFRMLPPRLRVLTTVIVVVVAFTLVTLASASRTTLEIEKITPRSRPLLEKIPHTPRILQLAGGDVTAVLPYSHKIPSVGERELLERYNPMPHDTPKLKAASTMERGKCTQMHDWQSGHNPNCNVIHESSWGFTYPLGTEPELLPKEYEFQEQQMFEDPNEQIRLVAGGAFRWVWMMREYDGTRRALKTLRIDSNAKNFDLRNFDRHRRDAVAMDELTASPLVVDMYGFCSNTGIFDWGEGGDLSTIFQRDPDISDENLLRIAYNVSMSIHDAHHFDKQGRATMAHTDIKPDQFLYQNGYYRLTDFNRVRFLLWNKKQNKQCGFNVQKNGGIWRAPEEYAYELETEKVDVYSLGNVLFFLLTGENPWKGYASRQIYKSVKNGERPQIPIDVQDSNEIFDRYMIEAIQMAWTHDKSLRPGAFEVAQKLKEGIQEYDAQQR